MAKRYVSEKDNRVYEKFIDEAAVNLSQHDYDQFIEDNCEHFRKAGISSVIIRRQLANCCEFCAAQAGVYDYSPGGYPPEIFVRHKNCRCLVTVKQEKGGYQDVWSKVEYKTQREARKARENEIKAEKVEKAEEKHRKAINIAREKGEKYVDSKEYYEEIAEATGKKGEKTESPVGSWVEIDGELKKVDGSNITYGPKPGEVPDAEFLCEKLGWDIRVMPEVKVPQHHPNPDYNIWLQDGTKLVMDRKGSKLAKDRVFALINNESKQASGFVINLTGSELTEEEIIQQGKAIFKREKTKFVDRLILIKDKKILAILEKINN